MMTITNVAKPCGHPNDMPDCDGCTIHMARITIKELIRERDHNAQAATGLRSQCNAFEERATVAEAEIERLKDRIDEIIDVQVDTEGELRTAQRDRDQALFLLHQLQLMLDVGQDYFSASRDLLKEKGFPV